MQYLLKLTADLPNNFKSIFILLCLFVNACQLTNTLPNIVLSDIGYEDFIKTYTNETTEGVEGKFKAFVDQKGYSGTFKLLKNKDRFQFILLSPLNQVITNISIKDNKVELDNKDQHEVLRSILKDDSIIQLKKIIQTQFINNEPISIKIDCCYIKINEFKTTAIDVYQPKNIRIVKKNFDLSVFIK